MSQLFLEGGGQRGNFTAGVLDYFLEVNLDFLEIYGISAGGLMATSFLGKQPRRSIEMTKRYTHDLRYLSLFNWLFGQSIFNIKYMYHKIPQKLPFDITTFDNNPSKFYVGACNLKTGKNDYFQIEKYQDSLTLKKLQATSSIPYFSKKVKIDDNYYLDGAIGDSFALEKYDQNQKAVFVLTRDDSYYKQPSKNNLFLELYYHKYPNFINSYLKRAEKYNQDRKTIEQLEQAGKIIVIRPSKPVVVGRMEKDLAKIDDLYQQGYLAAKQAYPKLKKYLDK